MVLSPYDQQVYDAGFKFVPQTQYLLNPFQIPQSGGGGSAPPGSVQPGLPSINIGGGGGDGGFNPYNTDMSKIRSDFRPDYDFRRYSEYGMNPTMMNIKEMDMYPDYFYDRPSAMQQKIGGLMNFIPGIGVLKRGAEFLGGALKSILPENERAIMENQARGAGIFTDDIGRIVTDDYNTAGGIMAGYNLNKIDADTFKKRRDTIMKGLMKTNPELARQRLELLDEAEEDILGLQKKTKDILAFRKKKKEADAAASQITDDAAITDTTKPDQTNTLPPNNDPSQDHDGDGIPNNVELAGGSYDGGYQSAEGGLEYTGGGGSYGGGSGTQGTTQTGDFSYADYAKGGRVYFMDGGIVDLVDIYD